MLKGNAISGKRDTAPFFRFIIINKKINCQHREDKVSLDYLLLAHFTLSETTFEEIFCFLNWVSTSLASKCCGRNQPTFLTTPVFASSSIKSPSLNTFVAMWVPTMQGFFISLLTMAAWQRMPPSSVTKAAAFSIAGT